ncbi:twin-arginine translocation signal domain-containing protein [Eggerthella sinensis]|uniref:twin-arginine translocation signal domain-containing protein n=1 Tax=Eggerthella sinensis TaxID=242230 RepID=UPI0022E89603|nr:twin-arginine translocation signal domain-containing protein [Eggerthella sinensis]
MGTAMDRRSFLGLAALGSLAAGAGLAGCAPQQSATATAQANATEADAAAGATGTSIPARRARNSSRATSWW